MPLGWIHFTRVLSGSGYAHGGASVLVTPGNSTVRQHPLSSFNTNTNTDADTSYWHYSSSRDPRTHASSWHLTEHLLWGQCNAQRLSYVRRVSAPRHVPVRKIIPLSPLDAQGNWGPERLMIRPRSCCSKWQGQSRTRRSYTWSQEFTPGAGHFAEGSIIPNASGSPRPRRCSVKEGVSCSSKLRKGRPALLVIKKTGLNLAPSSAIYS